MLPKSELNLICFGTYGAVWTVTALPHPETNCNDLYSTLASVALSSGPITNSEGGSQWRLRVPLKKDTQKAVNSNERNAQISDCYFKERLSHVKVYCL